MNSQDHSLTLGLGLQPQTLKPNNDNHHMTTNTIPKHEMVHGDNEPSLTLSLAGASAASLPNAVVVSSVKRERETTSSDDLDIERGSSRNISDEEDDGNCNNITAARKKLRLTKDQSAMLEESFKLQSTLNPKQKQVLAHRLNLRPRQVEVWFQNRRARTKLKKTEEDCEYMKKWCEALTDENTRLQKELEELKLTQPFYMHMPTTTTLTMCPSCERIDSTVPISNKNPFVLGSKSHFYAAASTSNRPLLVDN